MKISCYKYILSIIFLCFSFGILHAQEGDIFSTTIKVDKTAKNSIDAQTLAQIEGKKEALEIILKRIVKREYWDYLSFGKIAIFNENNMNIGDTTEDAPTPKKITFDDDLISFLEDGFQIKSEKRSSSSYSAEIIYRFKKQKIIDVLTNNFLPFTLKQKEKRLVLPILKYNQKEYLWENNNPWFSAVANFDSENELMPFIAPRDIAQDQKILPLTSVSSDNIDVLTQIANKYDVDEIDILYAQLERGDSYNKIELLVLPLFDRTSFYSPGTPGNNIKRRASINENSSDFFFVAEKLLKRLVNIENEEWKKNNSIFPQSSENFSIEVGINTYYDWRRLRSILKNSPYLKEFNIKSISTKKATISVSLLGSLDSFEEEMNNFGYYFNNQDGMYYLSSRR